MGQSDKKLCCIFSGKRDVSRVTLQEFKTVKPSNSGQAMNNGQVI